jgi:hypothetical protein
MFYVSEVRRDENTNQLSITAYDLIYDTVEYTVGELGLASYSILEFVEAAATLIGANSVIVKGVGEAETCFSTQYAEGANFDGDEYLRDGLDAVAEATQTIYYLDADNNLVFKRLDKDGEAVFTI